MKLKQEASPIQKTEEKQVEYMTWVIEMCWNATVHKEV